MKAHLISNLNIVSDKVRHFSISSNKNCTYSTKVFAPNLTSIRFKFSSYSDKLILEDAPQLVEAKFTIIRGPWCPRIMPKLKKLSLTCDGYTIPVIRFLEASPCLELFRLEARSACPIVCKVSDDRSPHYHLKVLEFSGFKVDCESCVDFFRYIVDKCSVLERIFITHRPAKYSRSHNFCGEDDKLKAIRQQLAAKINWPHQITLSVG